ncbi:hypothetical protein OG223_37465 [Streptomyces sp. NBC_01478]|uniref:hypothetical protein n=1 Tax=Streptomyces sp. NBC_01478 TaxID=2903882 RepID=UPI002E37881E|nr:hypothetical protein [Streptomyces sp. NBC_01478]
MADYGTLIRLEPAQLSEALWRLSPPMSPGRRARWVLALVDIAFTDYYAVNQKSDIDLTMRLAFASRLLDFIDRELEIDAQADIAGEYMRFSRKAMNDGVRDVPRNLQVDSVVARVLECFSLTRVQALQVAGIRRERYLDALTAHLQGEEFDRAVRVPGVAELLVLNNLLSEVRWFQEKVSDVNISGELTSWLDISADLALGETVAQLLASRRGRVQGSP